MKKILVTPSIKKFEELVNRKDIEVISVDVKAVEQSCCTQESFIGIVFYKELLNK